MRKQQKVEEKTRRGMQCSARTVVRITNSDVLVRTLLVAVAVADRTLGPNTLPLFLLMGCGLIVIVLLETAPSVGVGTTAVPQSHLIEVIARVQTRVVTLMESTAGGRQNPPDPSMSRFEQIESWSTSESCFGIGKSII